MKTQNQMMKLIHCCILSSAISIGSHYLWIFGSSQALVSQSLQYPENFVGDKAEILQILLGARKVKRRMEFAEMTQREEDNSYVISCDYVYIWKATKTIIMSYYLKYNIFLKQKNDEKD